MLPKKKAFADAYLSHGNGTQAAKDAGYSERSAYSQATRLLKDAEVREYIKNMQAQATADVGVTIQRCVQELAFIAFGDRRKLFTVDGDLKQFRDLPDEQAALISSFEVESGNMVNVEVTADEVDFKPVRVSKVKQWDKVKALELLMKHLGAFEKDNQQRALLDVSSLTPAELALLAGMYAKVNK